MSSNQALIDALTSRQIFIERYAKGDAQRLFRKLNRLSIELQEMISRDYGRVASVRLMRRIERLSQQILTEYSDDLSQSLIDFAQNESEFAQQSIIAATTATQINPASLNRIRAVMTDAPMQLLTSRGVQRLTISQAATQFSSSKSREVTRLVRDGFTAGRTSAEINRDLTELVSGRLRNQAEALVRTSTNHMGGKAREIVYQENADVLTGERYVATLDSNTTIECASLDGTIFPVGEGVQTPRHWGCRSVRVPVVDPEYDLGSAIEGERASVDGPVSARVTYGGWLKRQSNEMQDEVLGKERATLFRSGKLSIKRFTDDTGRVYTLDQLRALNPLAFT
jgi:SPP1 gp7 family putative phage head morphogenesis protein